MPFAVPALAALLTGCLTERIEAVPVVMTVETVDYAPEVLDQAADELAELPPPCPADGVTPECSAVHRLVIDCGDMRARARAAAE